MKKELIDFANYLFHTNKLKNMYLTIEQLVENYLSINDNAPTESRAINENEDKKKFCEICGLPTIKISGKWVCNNIKCYK